jgi:hypothetical protein
MRKCLVGEAFKDGATPLLVARGSDESTGFIEHQVNGRGAGDGKVTNGDAILLEIDRTLWVATDAAIQTDTTGFDE